MDIKPSQPLEVLLQEGSAQDQLRLKTNQHYLISLAKISSISWLTPSDTAPESATSLVGSMKLLIPMAGLIDKEAESKRLHKEHDKKSQERERLLSKLSNASFVDKAPAEVVAQERAKLAACEAALQQLAEQIAKIEKL